MEERKADIQKKLMKLTKKSNKSKPNEKYMKL